MVCIVGGMAMEMQKERKKKSIWSKIRKLIKGSVDNEIPLYGCFEITEQDDYDIVVIKTDKDVPFDDINHIIEELELDGEDVWVKGEIRLYV